MKLIVGTRGSELARIQARMITDALARAQPGLSCELRIITTHGDRNHSPIPEGVVGKTWFTEEIERALISRDIDIAVHSLKDLPLLLPPSVRAEAVLPRGDARDALVSISNAPLKELPKAAVVGTDSVRRKALLLHYRPDLIVKSIRGNVPTRLEKMRTEGYDAVVLAAAGLERLGLLEKASEIFAPDVFVPAAGQGALALEARTDRADIWELVARIQDPTTIFEIEIETEFARAVGGGCKTPMGAYAKCVNNMVYFTAMIGSATTPVAPLIREWAAHREHAKDHARSFAHALLAEMSP